MNIGVYLNKYWPAVLLLAGSLSVLIFFIIPTSISALNLYMGLDTMKKKIGVYSEKAEVLEKINKEDMIDKADRLNYYLPSNKDVSILLDTISSLTSDTGLYFDSLTFTPGEISTPSAVSAAREASFIDVPLSLNGDISGFLKFINNVERASPATRIRSVEISKRQGSADAGITRPYTFRVMVSTFYKPLPEKLGAISSSVAQLTEEDKSFIDSLAKPPQAYSFVGVSGEDFNGGKTDPFSRF